MRLCLYAFAIVAILFSPSFSSALTLKGVKFTMPPKGGDSFVITVKATKALNSASPDTIIKLGSETFTVPSSGLFKKNGKPAIYTDKQSGIKNAQYNTKEKVLTVNGGGLALSGLPRILPIRITSGASESCVLATLKKISSGKSKTIVLTKSGAVMPCAFEALRILEPAVLVVNESASATFSVAVKAGVTVTGGVLQVKEVNAAGKVGAKALCTMTDAADGHVDTTYTCDLTLKYPKVGEQAFIVEGTAAGKKIRSPSALLKIVPPIPTSAFSDFKAVESLNLDLSTLATDGKAGRVAIIDKVKELSVVADAFLSPNEEDIIIVYKSGLRSVIIGATRSSAPQTSALSSALRTTARSFSSHKSMSANSVGNSVLIWDAGFFPSNESESASIRKLFEASKDPEFSITEVDEFGATVNSLQAFPYFDVIITVTHGVMDQFGQIGMGTRTEFDTEFIAGHEDDIKAGKFFSAIGEGISGSVVVAMPNYFRSLSTFPNSFFYAGFCHGSQNDSLTSVLFGMGVASVVGYTETVYSDYASPAAKQLFCGMIVERLNVSEAFDRVDPKIDPTLDRTKEGRLHPEKRARIDLSGARDTKLGDTTLTLNVIPNKIEIPIGTSLEVATDLEVEGPIGCTKNAWSIKENFSSLEDSRNSAGTKIVVPDKADAPLTDSVSVIVTSATKGTYIGTASAAVKYICKRKNFKINLSATQVTIGDSITATMDVSDVDEDCKPEIEFFAVPEKDDGEFCVEAKQLEDGKSATLSTSKCTTAQNVIVQAQLVFRKEDGGVRYKLASPKATLVLNTQKSGALTTTYKVFQNPKKTLEVYVVAIAPAASVDLNSSYCAKFPYFSGNGDTTVASLGFTASPCNLFFAGCPADILGAGNLALLITAINAADAATSDSYFNLWQGLYAGALSVRKLNKGETCS